MRKCAQRELLGIGQADVSQRPLRARRSVWGLTGTPLLSSETRITELAALCGGTYVTGGAAHWRLMERASTRDVFLRYHESASSLLYLDERTRAAQAYVATAVQRNRIDAELSHIQRHEVLVSCALPADSPYERLVRKRSKEFKGSFGPPFGAATDAVWRELLEALAAAPSRQQALRDTIDGILAKDAWTKVIVFAPAGKAFESAREALTRLGRPVLIGAAAADEHGADSVGERLDLFSQVHMPMPPAANAHAHAHATRSTSSRRCTCTCPLPQMHMHMPHALCRMHMPHATRPLLAAGHPRPVEAARPSDELRPLLGAQPPEGAPRQPSRLLLSSTLFYSLPCRITSPLWDHMHMPYASVACTCTGVA